MTDHPRTPDGRYFVVNGKLWRLSNPALDPDYRELLVKELMQARRQVATANRTDDEPMLKDARRKVNAAKIALGERGPVWWTNGDPDFNRYLAKNTPYAKWFAELGNAKKASQ